jgi:hypothetical protein
MEGVMPFSSGRYYADANLGNVFIGTTAVAGVAPPAYNATAHTFCVWNPLGSNKNIIPIHLMMGWVSTTGAPGNVVISYQNGVGSQVATGAAITAATLVAPLNAKIGSGNASIAKFAPATITFAAATSLLLTTGISQLTITGTSTTGLPQQAKHDFDGTVIVSPGTAICVAGNIAITDVFDITLVWAEVPLV